MDRNSKHRGDETESAILGALVKNGYSVSIPFGDNDKDDLIVDDETTLHRVHKVS